MKILCMIYCEHTQRLTTSVQAPQTQRLQQYGCRRLRHKCKASDAMSGRNWRLSTPGSGEQSAKTPGGAAKGGRRGLKADAPSSRCRCRRQKRWPPTSCRRRPKPNTKAAVSRGLFASKKPPAMTDTTCGVIGSARAGSSRLAQAPASDQLSPRQCFTDGTINCSAAIVSFAHGRGSPSSQHVSMKRARHWSK